jgi:hypothetical protein
MGIRENLREYIYGKKGNQRENLWKYLCGNI